MAKKIALLALAGAAGSGKDTFFEQLKAQNPDVRNIKFADALTRDVSMLFPDIEPGEFFDIRNSQDLKDRPLNMFKPKNIATGSMGDRYCAFLVDVMGRDLDERMSCRDHLDIYGTKYVREYLNQPNYWVDRCLGQVRNTMAAGKIPVITDLRFPNEFEALKGLPMETALVQVVNKWQDAKNLTGIAEGHLKGLSFDLEVHNLFNDKEAMSVQFNLKYTF